MEKNFLEITQSIYSGFPLKAPDEPVMFSFGGKPPGSAHYCHVVDPNRIDTVGNLTITTSADNMARALMSPPEQYESVVDYFTTPNSTPNGIISSLGWSAAQTAKPMFHTLSFNVTKAEGHYVNLAGVDKDRITVEITQLEASSSAKVTVEKDETSQYWPLGNEQSFFFSKEALFDKLTAEYKDGILTLRAMKKIVPVVKPKTKTLEIE